jgi:hypothetical protein
MDLIPHTESAGCQSAVGARRSAGSGFDRGDSGRVPLLDLIATSASL